MTCCYHAAVRAMPRPLLFIAFAGLAGPAFADHAGPTGLGGGGSSLYVLGPGTLDEGDVSAGFRLTFAKPKRRSDAELEALAARHVHAHTSDYNLIGTIGAAYGVSHRLTVSAELPYVHRDDLREGEHSHVTGGEALSEVVRLGSSAGVGDLTLLAKYRLLGGDGGGLALIGGIKLPTGDTHECDREGERFETEHQPGTGSWDPIFGAAVGTGAGPLQLSASFLYQIAGKGAQQTRLGDRAQGGIAIAHRFGPAEHPHGEEDHHHEHAGAEGGEHEHGHASVDAFVELTGEWEGRQTIAGEAERESGGTALWLSPGVRLTSAGGLSAAFGVGVPLWQDIRASHPDNGYRVTFSVGKSF